MWQGSACLAGLRILRATWRGSRVDDEGSPDGGLGSHAEGLDQAVTADLAALVGAWNARGFGLVAGAEAGDVGMERGHAFQGAEIRQAGEQESV